jgi:hypothetical protein
MSLRLAIRPRSSIQSGVNVGYYLHRANNNPNVLAGSMIIHLDGLCPAFDFTDNPNLFGHLFGIEFTHDGYVYVRAISQFKIASCLRLSDELTYKLSHPSHSFCLDAEMPGLTFTQIFDQIHDRCIHIWSRNFNFFQPNRFAAPVVCIQTFLNGAVGICLPTHESWIKAYSDNAEMSAIRPFIVNPGTISQRSLEASNLNPNYRQARRQLHIKLVNKILYYHKPIVGSASYTCLQTSLQYFVTLSSLPFTAVPSEGTSTQSGHFTGYVSGSTGQICIHIYRIDRGLRTTGV